MDTGFINCYGKPLHHEEMIFLWALYYGKCPRSFISRRPRFKRRQSLLSNKQQSHELLINLKHIPLLFSLILYKPHLLYFWRKARKAPKCLGKSEKYRKCGQKLENAILESWKVCGKPKTEPLFPARSHIPKDRLTLIRGI